MRLRTKKNARIKLDNQPDLIVLDPKEHRGRWHELFGNDRPIHIEIGMGKGQFISRWSVKNPSVNYLGMDMFDELLLIASEKARKLREEVTDSDELRNLFLVRGNAEVLDEMFAPGELERIYLNFSDPWPKSKHAKRRLTHWRFLEKYKRALGEKGEIHFKTDSRSLFEFSLNSFSDSLLQMRHISLDLHGRELRDDLVMTEYETKFVGQGMPIYRLEAVIGEEAVRGHRAGIEAERQAAIAREEARRNRGFSDDANDEGDDEGNDEGNVED